MATTDYYTFGGTILAEEAVGGAGYRSYGADALGSVVATYDSNGKAQNSYRYSPYGQTLVNQTVSGTPFFTWVGSLGYRQTTRHLPEFYVTARHYSNLLTRWTTVDPLWPREVPYNYCGANPIVAVDPSGLVYAVHCDCISIEKCTQYVSINDQNGKQIFKWSGTGPISGSGCVHCNKSCDRKCGATTTRFIEVTSHRRPIRKGFKIEYDITAERTCDDSGCPGQFPRFGTDPLAEGLLGSIPLVGSALSGLYGYIVQFLPGCNNSETHSAFKGSNPVISVKGVPLHQFQVYASAKADYECCDCIITEPQGPWPCKPPPVV